MQELREIFDIKYGVNLELINCDIVSKERAGIPFVSRTEKNNGVSAFVEKVEGQDFNPVHTISVATSGSVGSSFYHDYEYYSGRDVYILSPKNKMSVKEMLFYCYVVEKNKYKFNYGRQANKTLPYLLVPSKILDNFRKIEIPAKPSKKTVISKKMELNVNKWTYFVYKEIYDVLDGFYNLKPDIIKAGDIPFISASEFNNGITSFHDIETLEASTKDGKNKNHDISKKIFEGGEHITVSNDGSIGYAFYQPLNFTCSHSVSPIKLKNHKMNKYIAIFLCSVIGLERYRWDYGRKWRPVRMRQSKIKLPTDKKGNPNWQFMEDYIKSLPYSASL